MRLFIGTTIDTRSIDTIRNAVGDILAHRIWRTAPVRQWHVTALFIGEYEPEQIGHLQSKVEDISKHTPPITLRNGHICTMPSDKPRMLWVKFDPDRSFTSLHLALATDLLVEPSAHKPYTPHITLARSRGTARSIEKYHVLDELVLDHLTLFNSRSEPDGSVHEALRTWPLSGKDPTGPVVVV